MKQNAIIWDEGASSELEEAAAWYEKQRLGLGDELHAEVNAVVARILREPKTYRSVHKNIRRALVNRFPYAVLFECEMGILVVISIFHMKRNPQLWRKRMD